MALPSRSTWLVSALVMIALLAIYLFQTVTTSTNPSLATSSPPHASAPPGPAVVDVEIALTDSSIARFQAEDGEARKVIGRATTPDGEPVAGAAVRIGQSREALSEEIVASTDERGILSFEIPPHWISVCAVVSTGSGAQGRATSPASRDRATLVDLGTIVVQRHTSVTLEWKLEDRAGELLSEHELVLSVFAREHKQASLFGPKPTTQEMCTIDHAVLEGTTTAEILMDDPVDICWAVKALHRRPVVVFTDPVPEGAGACESRCTINQQMMFFGNVVDQQGAPVPYYEFSVNADLSQQQGISFGALTDERGRFFRVVPLGASGCITPVIGSISSGTTWTAGAPVTVVADTSDNLRLEVVDSNGRPVTDYSAQTLLISSRDKDGNIRDSTTHTQSGITYSHLTKLEPGTKLFVHVSGEGEFVHEVANRVAPSAEPYHIRLGKTSLGSLTVKLRDAHSRDPSVYSLSVYLKDDVNQDSRNKWDYRLHVPTDRARAGWTARFVHPGTYRYLVTIKNREVARGNVKVEAGKESTIDVML